MQDRKVHLVCVVQSPSCQLKGVMHTAKELGRKPVKQVINDYQQRRRLQALERQKIARKDALNKARHFFVELSSEKDEYPAREQVPTDLSALNCLFISSGACR
jgi:hypothetical protein